MALLLAAPSAASAAVQEIRVLAKGVDRSSTKASELALDYAKKRAVFIVARKMQVVDAAAKVAKLRDDQMREIVRGATVLQTRRDGEITYADVSVTVMDDVLRRALGIEIPTTSAADAAGPRAVLVLPVYATADRAFLWEGDNQLTTPLRSEAVKQGHGTIILPAADFDDRRLVDYQNALEVKPDELATMFTRYGVDEIIVAIVKPGAEGTAEPTSVLLRRLSPPPTTVVRVEELTLPLPAPADSTQARVQVAAASIAAAASNIAGATSMRDQERLKGATQLPVNFRYATARELGMMQEAVRGAPGVMQLSMPAIALENMNGIVYFSGDKEAIRQTLLKQGILIADDGTGWRLSLH